jgi:hypothetical protein
MPGHQPHDSDALELGREIRQAAYNLVAKNIRAADGTPMTEGALQIEIHSPDGITPVFVIVTIDPVKVDALIRAQIDLVDRLAVCPVCRSPIGTPGCSGCGESIDG